MKRSNKTMGMRLARLLRVGLGGEKGKNGAGRFARGNKSGICRFCYTFDGTIGGNNYRYTVSKNGDEVIFAYESMMRPDDVKARLKADKDLLDRLDAIYREFRLAEWNGYSKYNSLVCDGSGFSLSIKFNDGGELYANGTNAFPPRYHEFVEATEELFEPLKSSAVLKCDTDSKQKY